MFYALFAEHARKQPAKIAIAETERTISYGELDAVIERLARNLVAAGVGSQSRVAVSAGDGIEFTALAYGVARTGAQLVHLPPSLVPSPLARSCRLFQPTHYIELTPNSTTTAIAEQLGAVRVADDTAPNLDALFNDHANRGVSLPDSPWADAPLRATYREDTGTLVVQSHRNYADLMRDRAAEPSAEKPSSTTVLCNSYGSDQVIFSALCDGRSVRIVDAIATAKADPANGQRDDTLSRINASWDRRAQVKKKGVLDVPFEADKPDFVEALLPFATHPRYQVLPDEAKQRLLTYGWLAFNQKAIDIEKNVLVPACLGLLRQAEEAGDLETADSMSGVLVDEAFHVHLVRQANQITLFKRGLPSPKFPLCRMVRRMRTHQEGTGNRQRELTTIGAAIVTEVFIKGYLGTLARAEDIQPLAIQTTRAHLADESVHALIFQRVATDLCEALSDDERNWIVDVMIRSMSWFEDPELDTWQTILDHLELEHGQEIVTDCRKAIRPIDYTDLQAFFSKVGIDASDRIGHIDQAEARCAI